MSATDNGPDQPLGRALRAAAGERMPMTTIDTRPTRRLRAGATRRGRCRSCCCRGGGLAHHRRPQADRAAVRRSAALVALAGGAGRRWTARLRADSTPSRPCSRATRSTSCSRSTGSGLPFFGGRPAAGRPGSRDRPVAARALVPLALGRVAALGFWAWRRRQRLVVIAYIGNGGPGGGKENMVDLFLVGLGLSLVGLLLAVGRGRHQRADHPGARA